MSASVCYRVLKHGAPTLAVNAPSKFGEIMSARFGSEPWQVGPDDLPWIQGVIDSQSGMQKDFESLRAKVDKHGAIEVWREY